MMWTNFKKFLFAIKCRKQGAGLLMDILFEVGDNFESQNGTLPNK